MHFVLHYIYLLAKENENRKTALKKITFCMPIAFISDLQKYQNNSYKKCHFYFVSEAPKFENLFFVFVFLITLLKSSYFNDLDYISGHNG